VAEDKRLDSAVISVDGRPLATDLYGRLQLLRVRESVQLPDDFELRFDDQHFELFDAATFAIGSRVDISLRAESQPVLVTAGEVTAIVVEPGQSGRHQLVVQGLDLAHRLARGPKSRTFQSMSTADIANRIAGEYGLTAQIDGGSEVIPYVAQAVETDYALLQRLAARGGLSVWVRERVLHVARRVSGEGAPPTLTWGGNLHRFSVRFSSTERTDEVRVKGWDPIAKQVVDGRASQPDRGSDAPAAKEFADDAQRAFGRVTRQASRIAVADRGQADKVATSLLQRAAGSEVVLRGEIVGDPDLGAGSTVKLDGVGTRLAGSYRVTSVEHLYGAGRPYVSRFTCGGVEPADLAGLVGATGGPGTVGAVARPEHGLMVGVVTNNDDPEQLCRVKVRLSAISEQDETTWARLVMPGAGASRGLQWVPEVDDEVVVGFEGGDYARAVVLGGLWNRNDAPPDVGAVSNGKVQKRLLTSRNDHRLVLTDDPDACVDLALKDAQCELHLNASESRLHGDTKLVISASQIEINATSKLSLKAPQVEVSADAALTMSGKPIRLN
jgi:phage protein D/phage baseplate assembly protein gpV